MDGTMKILALIISSTLLTACAMSPTYYNPNITDPTALERQRIIDEGYCTQAAAGAVPLPQVRYYQSGIQNYQISGNIQSYDPSGYSTRSNYIGSVNSYQNPGDAFATGVANGINMGAAIRANKEHDVVFQGCMYSLGWTTDKNSLSRAAQMAVTTNDNDTTYFSIALAKAEAGDSEMMGLVAYAYEIGKGTAINLDKAIYWATKASEKENSGASFQLAKIYYGKDYPLYTNLEKMSFYLQQSAEQGDVNGQGLLGFEYLSGDNAFHRDFAKAMKWSIKACQKNNAMSCGNVGSMFLGGLGVKKDLIQAHRYFLKAERLGLEGVSSFRKEIEKDMTDTQRREAEKNVL